MSQWYIGSGLNFSVRRFNCLFDESCLIRPVYYGPFGSDPTSYIGFTFTFAAILLIGLEDL